MWNKYPEIEPTFEKIYQVTVKHPNDIYTTVALWSKFGGGWYRLKLTGLVDRFKREEVIGWKELSEPMKENV